MSVFYEDWFLVFYGVYYCWNIGFIVVMNFYDFVFGKIYFVEVFDEGGDKVLLCLFVVVDNIDFGL